jgi:hypothetical protein
VLLLSLCPVAAARAAAGPALQVPRAAAGPALQVPRAQLDAALRCAGNLATGPTPVLLVPGTGEDPDFYGWNYTRALTATGTPLCSVTLPEHTTADIQLAAEYVVHAIRAMHASAGRRIAIIGHSQGGMSPRWALRWWPDTRRMVDDLVGLAASNHGTTAARTACGSGCNAATWQQRDDSRFVAALNAGRETFAGISYTSVFTRFDEIVTPNQDAATGSTSLRTGDGQISNVLVQDVCPPNGSEHLVLGSSDAVGYALAVDALTHPGPADAARLPPTMCAQPFQPGVDPATFENDAATSYAQVAANFASGRVLAAEPPLACYAGGPCSGPGGSRGGGAGDSDPAGGRSGARPRLRLSLVGPRTVRAGQRATLRLRVRALRGGRLQPVAGVRVAVAGRAVRTDRRGRATLRKRYVKRGRRTVVATRRGYRSARLTVWVVRRG